MIHYRIPLALALPLAVVTSRWHTELIYPIERSAADTISSGFVTLQGRWAVAFDHALWYVTILLAVVVAIDLLQDTPEA